MQYSKLANPVVEQLTDRQRFWLNHLEACQTAGQSISAYAREHDLSAGALYHYRSLMRKREQTPVSPSTFARVHLSGAAPGQTTIRLPNGIEIDWPRGGDGTELSAIVDHLLAAR